MASDVRIVPFGEPLVAAGSSAAPGAGSAFATVAAPPAGKYRVWFYYSITGAAETAALNIKLILNNLSVLTVPTGSLNSAAVIAIDAGTWTLDGTNTVKLAAVAASTASTVYTGSILVQRMA